MFDVEMFRYGFMLRAFLAVAMVGLLCSVLSFFVVLNRLSFMGAGISHALLGGLAIGVLAGVNPLYTGGISGVVLALLVGYISQRAACVRIPRSVFCYRMALGALLSLQEVISELSVCFLAMCWRNCRSPFFRCSDACCPSLYFCFFQRAFNDFV